MPRKNYIVVLTLLALLATVTASTAKQSGSAVEQFQSLQSELRKSYTANDWHSFLVSATKLKELLNDAPDSLLEVARAEVRLGDLNAAVRQLQQFVRMGQSTDVIATLTDFSALRQDASFAKIQSGMEANRTPISLGSTAFLMSDPGLLAEDVDYDPHIKRFFITSVREKKIVSTDGAGTSTDFAKAPDDWPMLAVKVDPSRGVVWATEVAIQGFSAIPESDWGRSAVLCYDARTGKLLRRIEGPRQSALGDMVLTIQGDVIVSDGNGGGVYRVPASAATNSGASSTTNSAIMERLDDGDFVSPQTPAMYPDGKRIFVPDYVRGIGVLDIATKSVHWLLHEGKFALNGIDGLSFDRGRLIAVQNGTSPERVVAFTLDPSFTKIVSETIIERSTGTLGDPTHGVVIDQDFYYIANSGWDITDAHGDLKPGAKPSVPRIMRVHMTA
jgi:hypothetical protein